MDKIKLLALFGESSSGKDSILHWLTNNVENTHSIVSYTSRPSRDYEVNGREYYFIPQKDFEKLIVKNQMLEFTCFNNWYYGTGVNQLEKDKINIGIFNPRGIKYLLNNTDNLDILPVWIKSDEKTRLLRSLNREASPNCEEICRRFLIDKKDFNYINFDYEIYLNDNEDEDYHGFLKRPKIAKFFTGQE